MKFLLDQGLKYLWPALKWLMFLLVLAFVAYHACGLWKGFEGRSLSIRWSWLALSLVTSIVAWLPSAWYWRELLRSVGIRVSWPLVIRAYYCGHLGKYVPGKAAVLVIRSALLKAAGVAGPSAALTVTVETLTYMWAGSLLAVLLYPSLAPHLDESLAAPFASPVVRIALVAGIVCAGAFLLRMLMRSHRRLMAVFRGAEAQSGFPAETASIWTCLIGVCVFLGAWWLQGLTLGLTIQAVSVEPVSWQDWPFWTGTAAAAVVAGFVALFAPGGLGVREGLLMELLRGQLGPHEAVAVALLARAVSLAGEILTAGALYYGLPEVQKATTTEGQGTANDGSPISKA